MEEEEEEGEDEEEENDCGEWQQNYATYANNASFDSARAMSAGTEAAYGTPDSS